MARRITDLDERDYQARAALRVALRDARGNLGLSQRALGERLGFDGANVRRLERQGVDQSYAITVMRWARALDLELVMEPVGFPPVADDVTAADSVNDMLAMLAGTTTVPAEEATVAALISRLTRIRTVLGVTAVQLAARFGTTPTAVSMVETTGRGSALVTLQRHARGIARCSWRAPDGYLDVRLEPAQRM